MKKLITLFLAIGLTGCALLMPKKAAANTNISGQVESRCEVVTDIPGYYGNPSAFLLTTLPASNGQVPQIRITNTLANAYKAIVSYPTSFSSSPSLSNSVAWSGAVAIASASSSDMSGYQAASTVTNNGAMRTYNLTHAGTIYVTVTSTATYGGNKAFPGGQYVAVAEASCVAQ